MSGPYTMDRLLSQDVTQLDSIELPNGHPNPVFLTGLNIHTPFQCSQFN